MSISSALSNAVTGLTANSRMAETVSNNMANALTEGYARREVDLASVNLAGQGAGVQVVGIRRVVNEAALADRRLADADLAGRDRTSTALNRLESLMGTVDDPASLANRMIALEQAFVTAAGDPASEQRLRVVVNRLGELSASLKNVADNVQRMRQDADVDIARDIETLNRSLLEVEQLNGDISRVQVTGGDPSAIMDARQLVIDRIASIVPIREVARPNGIVSLMTTTGEVLIDGPARQYDFVNTPTIVADMTFAGGTLGGITRDGVPLSATNGFGKLSGGSLAASFALRDGDLVEASNALDEIAADIITRFADPTVDTTLAPGDPGLLTDRGAAHDPLDIVGLASRMTVNAAVDPGQGGSLALIRDGVGATVAGPLGEPAQLNRFRDVMNAPRSIGPAIPALSASGLVERATTSIATDRLFSDDALSYASSRHATLQQAELADGVDTDQELQMLLRIEQAYAANAKVIQTVDAMMRSLMEI